MQRDLRELIRELKSRREVLDKIPPDSIGKPILIQVYRYARYAGEEASCYDDEVAWYIIRETSTGPKISEIFRGLPRDVQPFNAPLKRNCVLIGPNLYDMGGTCTTRDNFLQFSNRIRVLDTRNPSDGWKTDELPFCCAGALTTVSGKFIYLFTGGCSPCLKTVDHVAPSPWAYVYDTIKREAYELKPPINNRYVPGPPFCAPLGDVGVVVPIIYRQSEETFFYFHDPDERIWKPVQHIKAPHSVEMWGLARYVINNSPLSTFWNKPHTITSDGIYFVLCGPFIHAYNIYPWKFCDFILMPELNIDYDVDHVFMVLVAGYELCILWHQPYSYERTSTLYYARILVSLHPTPTATLLRQAEFDITAIEVVNCLQ